MLVISSNDTAEAAVTQHVAAADAAYAAGAQRVLYTSHQAAAAGSAFAPMLDHAATEDHLAVGGTPFTSLRNGFYTSTVALLVGQALATGELLAPADGPVSWTTHADLAEAAAIVLADGGFEGPTPPLTASQAVDLDDVAALLSSITGRTVTRTLAEDDDYAAAMAARGAPAARVDILMGMFRAMRRGEFAATDPALERLIGRPPVDVRTVLEGVVAAA